MVGEGRVGVLLGLLAVMKHFVFLFLVINGFSHQT